MRVTKLAISAFVLTTFGAASGCKAHGPRSTSDQVKSLTAGGTSDPNDLGIYSNAASCRRHPFNVKLQENLTQNERKAMLAYQGDGYKAINALLRGMPLPEGSDEKQVAKHAADILSGIKKQKPVIVGSKGPLEVYRVFVSKKPPSRNSIYKAKGLFSTSFISSYGSGNTLFGFGTPPKDVPPTGHMAVSITIPQGMRGFVMNSLEVDSKFPGECEMLFAHGAQFKVESTVKKTVDSFSITREVNIQRWKMVDDGVGDTAVALVNTPAEPLVNAEGFALYQSDGAPNLDAPQAEDAWYDEAEAAGLTGQFEDEFMQVESGEENN